VPRPVTLSYSMNKKTDKLLKTHRSMRRAMSLLIPIGAIAGLLWIYFIWNMDRYLSGLSLFNFENASSTNTLTPLEAILFKVLLLASLIFGCIFTVWNNHNEKFKKLKKEILDILELNPCYHKDPCTCKDDYCKWLDQVEGVDFL
jgi:hypothetical protein